MKCSHDERFLQPYSSSAPKGHAFHSQSQVVDLSQDGDTAKRLFFFRKTAHFGGSDQRRRRSMDEMKHLSKRMEDKVTNSEEPTLVLVMISLVVSATIVSVLRAIFG
jgi:hypothetical protein